MWRLLALCLLFSLTGCATMVTEVSDEEKARKIAEVNVQLGVGYLRKGDLELAQTKLLKALDADDEYPAAHTAIAIFYERMGEPDKATKHYREAVKLAPNDGVMLNNYGVFLCKNGQWLEADEYFQRAISNQLYKTVSAAYENAGQCALQIPDLNKAEQYLRKALQINAELPLSLFLMADVQFKKKRYLQARGYIQRLEAISIHSPQSLWLIIQVEKELDDLDAAQQYVNELRSRFPDSDEMGEYLKTESANTH